MGRKLIVLLIVLAIFSIGYRTIVDQPSSFSSPLTKTQEQEVFGSATKTDHWESNTPVHATTFASIPINIVIDFNATLSTAAISITKDRKEYGAGMTTIDSLGHTMRRSVDVLAPDGTYLVKYTACWADGRCQNGTFQFAIDRGLRSGYADFGSKEDVYVDIAQREFLPKKIRVRKNTRVTWINKDSEIHSVRTDSYAANSYFPKQNSKDLKSGDGFSVVFIQPGEYPYHSDSNPQTMAGSVLVE